MCILVVDSLLSVCFCLVESTSKVHPIKDWTVWQAQGTVWCRDCRWVFRNNSAFTIIIHMLNTTVLVIISLSSTLTLLPFRVTFYATVKLYIWEMECAATCSFLCIFSKREDSYKDHIAWWQAGGRPSMEDHPLWGGSLNKVQIFASLSGRMILLFKVICQYDSY